MWWLSRQTIPHPFPTGGAFYAEPEKLSGKSGTDIHAELVSLLANGRDKISPGDVLLPSILRKMLHLAELSNPDVDSMVDKVHIGFFMHTTTRGIETLS